MIRLSLVFLEKNELQHSGKSILFALFGIPSIWGITERHLPVEVFRSNIASSDPEETRANKKDLILKKNSTFYIFSLIS